MTEVRGHYSQNQYAVTLVNKSQLKDPSYKIGQVVESFPSTITLSINRNGV